ncbi:PLD nuclease N-terminal domain-containing protein [Rhodococcus sp. NPDC058505]|uniref:PLD nuclease N-terminal domain-containing protein n=1 Tax=unclassified Rhodococcus (in: high G+C Gram-positive bacteria) TaxID=192944 RepID=UPI0036592457
MTTVGAVVVAACFVIAAVSIVRSQSVGLSGKLAWMSVAFVLPVIGPLLWFLVGARYSYGIDGGNPGR